MTMQGHGCLHDIYASVEKSAALKGWDGVDLLIIGGDFQVKQPIPPPLREANGRPGRPQFQRHGVYVRAK